MSLEGKTYLVTGANAGLGFETCLHLAKLNVGKVILGCRSQTKAEAAVEKLVAKSKKDKSIFEVAIIDTSKLDTCRKAAEELGELDGVVCNAGGLLFGNALEKQAEGATNIFAANILGHAVLVEKLQELGKLKEDAVVVLSGSEAARGIPSMGFQAPSFQKPYQENITSRIDGSAYTKKSDAQVSYGEAKAIGALYFSHLNRNSENNVRFITVSPGFSYGTSGADGAKFFQRMMFKYLAPVIMKLSGNAHNASVGAQRYVDGLQGKLEGGGFYASAKGKISGKLTDQATFATHFGEVELQDEAAKAVRAFF